MGMRGTSSSLSGDCLKEMEDLSGCYRAAGEVDLGTRSVELSRLAPVEGDTEKRV